MIDKFTFTIESEDINTIITYTMAIHYEVALFEIAEKLRAWDKYCMAKDMSGPEAVERLREEITSLIPEKAMG